jgi:uncharacterized DUF497 family protein
MWMAKFFFIEWLLEFLISQPDFVFEWDDGNSYKSLEKHGIENDLVESSFNDLNLLALGEQYQPPAPEARYGILGKAINGDILFVCFTIRQGKIRPISSRISNQRERGFYEKKIR